MRVVVNRNSHSTSPLYNLTKNWVHVPTLLQISKYLESRSGLCRFIGTIYRWAKTVQTFSGDGTLSRITRYIGNYTWWRNLVHAPGDTYSLSFDFDLNMLLEHGPCSPLL